MSDQKEKEPWALGHALTVVSKGGEAVADVPALTSDPHDYDINEYLPDDFQRAGQEIRDAFTAGQAAAHKTALEAAKIGALLTLVKGNLKHGGFVSWVTRNCPFTPRQAQNYMRVASRLGELQHTDPTNAQRVAQSSFREALKLLAEPRQKPVFQVGVHASGDWGHAFPQGRGFVQRPEGVGSGRPALTTGTPQEHKGKGVREGSPKPRLTEADAWAMGREAADALLAALQHLKDRGARPNVTATLALARKVAGFVNRTKPQREPDVCMCNACEDARADGRPLPKGKAHRGIGPRGKQPVPKEYGLLGAGGDPRGGAIVRRPKADPPSKPRAALKRSA